MPGIARRVGLPVRIAYGLSHLRDSLPAGEGRKNTHRLFSTYFPSRTTHGPLSGFIYLIQPLRELGVIILLSCHRKFRCSKTEELTKVTQLMCGIRAQLP